jgi:hypothetical protein
MKRYKASGVQKLHILHGKAHIGSGIVQRSIFYDYNIDQIKEDEMGKECSMHWRDEKCMSGNLKGRNQLLLGR